MKKGIHPNYHKIKVTCTTCGAVFETGSILNEIKVDTCSNCHPFYTGKQTFVQADGRVEKFNKRYGLNKCLFTCIEWVAICTSIYFDFW